MVLVLGNLLFLALLFKDFASFSRFSSLWGVHFSLTVVMVDHFALVFILFHSSALLFLLLFSDFILNLHRRLWLPGLRLSRFWDNNSVSTVQILLKKLESGAQCHVRSMGFKAAAIRSRYMGSNVATMEEDLLW
jgi:hypothetical protein